MNNKPKLHRSHDELHGHGQSNHHRCCSPSNRESRHCSGNEEKYRKRRRQLQHDRLLLGLCMTLCLLVVTLVTFVVLRVQRHLSTKQYGRHPISSGSTSDAPLMQRLRQSLSGARRSMNVHRADLEQLDRAILKNEHSGIRWLNPSTLVSLDPVHNPNPLIDEAQILVKPRGKFSHHGPYFRVSRRGQHMTWQDEWERLRQQHPDLMSVVGTAKSRPKVDYTRSDIYSYPIKQLVPPTSGYPRLQTLGQLFEWWPQDQIDSPPSFNIEETLQHFDYNDPKDMEAALLYRERKLPFKLTNVPELLAAKMKWTDEYVSHHFDVPSLPNRAQGKAEESPTNFFAFYQPQYWNIEGGMGLPPTRNNDWTFATWAEHAQYADASSLSWDQPHFYWQAGVQKEEREYGSEDSWTFISRDLPTFSSPHANFISSSPQDQKGIQCRFGERGVTAAIHYDAGKNMIGMIQGAKRYVLAPPNQCSLLGINTNRMHATFRHSLLNFGHLNHLDDPNMPPNERAWLERSRHAKVVQTVLKAGEVLFIPSHWFHYIISLQKNAQCNVRSGVDLEGDEEFGGHVDVTELCDPSSYALHDLPKV